MMEKRHKYFNHAYKDAVGRLYDWDEDGDPMDSDSFTKGFYMGFKLGLAGQEELKQQIKELCAQD